MAKQTKPPAQEDKDETREQPAESTPDEAVEAQTPDDGLAPNQVTVEDAGTLRKKVTIEVPRERIDAKFDEMFGELGRTAQVPGFRIGRAPKRLIEKRFGKEVSEDVRNALVGDAMGSALEDEKLKVLGQPEIKLEEIELPDDGAMSFSLEVEIEPEFDLPNYKGIEVARSKVEITDEHVEQAVQRMLAPMGKLKPIDAKSQPGDVLEADVKIACAGDVSDLTNVEVRVAPGQVEGIPLEDLAEAAAGKKSGETFTVKTKVPAGHPNERWRDKDVDIQFEVKDVKRLELPELTDELASNAGFGSPDELREAARRSMGARLEAEKQQSMRDQVCKFLLDKASFDLPEGVTARHTQRVLQRRYVEMMMRGVGREEIERNMEQLEAQAAEQAAGGLKLSFILGKLAEAEGVEVDEGEINARIAQIARSQKRRPERLRSELDSEGRLNQLTSSILEEKAIDKVLAQAKIVDAKPEQAPTKEPKPKPKPKAKKTGKKSTKPKAKAPGKARATRKKPSTKGKTRGAGGESNE